jgi:hypothetical protein
MQMRRILCSTSPYALQSPFHTKCVIASRQLPEDLALPGASQGDNERKTLLNVKKCSGSVVRNPLLRRGGHKAYESLAKLPRADNKGNRSGNGPRPYLPTWSIWLWHVLPC